MFLLVWTQTQSHGAAETSLPVGTWDKARPTGQHRSEAASTQLHSPNAPAAERHAESENADGLAQGSQPNANACAAATAGGRRGANTRPTATARP